MKKFDLVKEYSGYSNKKDITNLDSRYLVPPSQNVIINDGEKVSSRPGYSLYGASSVDMLPPTSSFEWKTGIGYERALRAYDDELEVYYASAWRRIASGFTAVDFNFTTVWNSTELLVLLLFVNGDANMRMWSGGITTYASATANTLTKQGATSWAAEGFLKNGTRQVNLNNVTYTYTGGESTTTLTGVTPDPTLTVHTAGDVAIQTVRTTASTPASGFNNDIIATLKNQVYVGDLKRRDVYVSLNTNHLAYTFTSPTRLPGEGAILTLDANIVGFAPQEEDMYIGVDDGWFKTKFTLAAALTGESLTVERLKTSPQQGPQSQSSICKVKNSVVFVCKDKSIDSLGRVTNLITPDSRPLSDIIKNELADYSFLTDPHLVYNQNQLFALFPSESKTLIYDFDKKYWMPPQLMSLNRLAIVGTDLYGHSSVVTESYKIFDTSVYSDNGNPIDSKAAFAYRNYNQRAWKKKFDEWYTEVYMTPNTELSLQINYDFGGFGGIVTKIIKGTETRFKFFVAILNSLGKWALGKNPIGSVSVSDDTLPKYRKIDTVDDNDFYEVQSIYSSNGIDQRWELLASGGNIKLSDNDNQDIKD